jgi:hypothetical protein
MGHGIRIVCGLQFQSGFLGMDEDQAAPKHTILGALYCTMFMTRFPKFSTMRALAEWLLKRCVRCEVG